MGFQLFLLFFFVVVTCSLAILFKRSFEESLPLLFFGIVIILFIFGMIHILEIGVFFILGIGLLLSVAAVWKILSTGNRLMAKECIGKICTPAVLFFVFLFVILSFLNRGRVMYNWDELSHWGSTVKEMLLYKSFGTVAETEPLYGAYPPGMALFQYFVLRLNGMFGGEFFSEWRLFFSYQMFGYAIMFPFLRELHFKKPVEALLRIVIMILIPQFFLNCFFQRIYIDTFLSVLFGVLLACVFFMERRGIVDDLLFLSGCTMLVLTKDAGLFLCMVPAVAYTLKNMPGKQGLENKKSSWIRILLCWSAILIPWILWKIEVIRSGCFIAFQEPIKIGEYFRIIFGTGEGNKQTIWNNFFSAFFSPGLSVSNFGIKITPFSAIIAVFGSFCFSKFIVADKHKLEEERPFRGVMIILLGAVLYCIGLGAIYLYRIQDVTTSSLPSFSRYISVYLLGISACAFLGVVQVRNCGNNRIVTVMILLILILAPQSGISDFVTGKYTEESLLYRKPYQRIADQVLDYAGETDANVFVLEQGGPGWSFWFYRTLLMPMHVRNNANRGVGELSWSIGSRTDGGYAVSPEELREILKDRYDIFIVSIADDAFREDYVSLFANPEDLKHGEIFAVDKTNGLLRLIGKEKTEQEEKE